MTKVLVTDRSDNTYFLAVIDCAGYDPAESVLWLSFAYGEIQIFEFCSVAEEILRDLFDRSVVDLSGYKARIVWDSDEVPE